MKYTTPCFVRVEDADERKKLIDWAEKIGYEIISRSGTAVAAFVEHGALGAYANDGNAEAVGTIQAGRYDCGTDIELFKALAAMNDENDLYQAFIDDDGNFAISNSAIAGIKAWEAVRFATPRKATAEEIIEHFKNK